jgi:hypothetical protein
LRASCTSSSAFTGRTISTTDKAGSTAGAGEVSDPDALATSSVVVADPLPGATTPVAVRLPLAWKPYSFLMRLGRIFVFLVRIGGRLKRGTITERTCQMKI